MRASKTAKGPAKNRGDIPAFFKDLESGAAITMLLAPAAWTALPELSRILGFFRSLGVRAFVPVLPYADISAWVYYRLIAEEPEGVFISTACAGMNRYIAGKYPGAAPSPKVYSPLLAAARCLKTYSGAGGVFAFLSPCSQKRFEFSVRGEELIRYNITVAALSGWLSTESIDLCQYPPVTPDSIGRLFKNGLTAASFGNLSDALVQVYPRLNRQVTQGIAGAEHFFAKGFRGLRSRPFFFEPYACVGGCANGSGIPKTAAFRSSAAEVLENRKIPVQNKGAHTAAILERFSRFDAEFDMHDFVYQIY
jgi:iron only hydrogenase large subunit-like protein